MNNPPQIICEIGCNHKGSFELAKKMIEIASTFCDADIIKFQKRNIDDILSDEKLNKPHPDPENAYGNSYIEHRKALELSLGEHRELKKICESFNKIYSSSVWDIASAEEILSLSPKLIKVPSGLNLDFPLLNFICENFKGEIHVSLGMTYLDEIKEIYNFFENKNKLSNLVLYYCKSTYPLKEESYCLNQLVQLKKEYGDKINSIGFSGHHVGISIDVAALALGARYIERHFNS